MKLRQLSEPVAQEEERDEEISGAQFLCETVIRSLALEEAPDHRPLRRTQHSSRKPQSEDPVLYCSVMKQIHSLLFNMRCLNRVFSLFWTNLSVVSRGSSFCLERAVEAEKTETGEKDNEELCAVVLESSALLPNTSFHQTTREEETKPGQRMTQFLEDHEAHRKHMNSL